MRQLAEGRAAAVRNFLVTQGNVDPTRVFARIGDVHGAPKQAGDRRARVEFARATD
jgi:outer membrane protein OmpA-like peptidoglycan-associated protein